jgi:hypothetical protein
MRGVILAACRGFTVFKELSSGRRSTETTPRAASPSFDILRGFLYVACWGTRELRQYDVTNPMSPKLTGSVRLGGVARRDKPPSGKPFSRSPATRR